MEKTYYLENGITAAEDSREAYAKKECSKEGRCVYYVRRATIGPDSGHLLNPWGMHFNKGADDAKFERTLGKRRYEYYKVSEEVFKLYVKYLETRNARLYREAERAMD